MMCHSMTDDEKYRWFEGDLETQEYFSSIVLLIRKILIEQENCVRIILEKSR